MTVQATERWRDGLLIFMAGSIYRLVLLFQFPALYGLDPVGRMLNRDSFFMYHSLPLVQSLIVGGFRLTGDVMLTRAILVVAGSLTAIGFYLFLSTFLERRVAILGGLFFTFCPIYVFLSLVPYQEFMFLGLFYGSLAFLADRDSFQPWGYLVFGLAALTRYEAWFLLPFLFAWRVAGQWQGNPKKVWLGKGLVEMVCLGWGPVAWMLINQVHWGRFNAFLFHKDGTAYMWHPHFDSGEVVGEGFQMLAWLLRYGSPLVLFAVPGFVFGFRQLKSNGVLKLATLTAGVLLFFLTFIAGPDFDGLPRFVSLPLSVVLIFAALGFDEVLGFFSKKKVPGFGVPWLGPFVSVAAVIGLMIYAAVPVASANGWPEPATTLKVARFLDERLEGNDKAVVVAEGFRDYPNSPPMAFQRIGAQSNFGSRRILSSGMLPMEKPEALIAFAREQNLKWVVCYSEFDAWVPADRFFIEILEHRKLTPVRVFDDTARVFRVEDWQAGTLTPTRAKKTRSEPHGASENP